jgi:hypothetical protein
MNFNENILDSIVTFLNSINIKVVEEELKNDTFLPGLSLKKDTILMDKTKLKYPGDLLHEAGHIAVTEENLRPLIGTEKMEKNWPTLGDEIAAILWSYAALSHLKLDPIVVFHPYGYKGSSEWYIEQFTNEVYTGLPLLKWMGLCSDDDKFPIMKKWLR